MNNLPKWKWNIIKWLAGDKPVLLNYCAFPQNVKDYKAVEYYFADKITMEEAAKRAVLVPSMFIK